MAKRSRANRTEKATYQNIRNEHKYIDVVHHGDGHYYIIQYIKHELPERTVAKGDLVVEQCITEAKKLFETVNDPHEWDVAVSYLKKRYGADAVDEAIKIEHLEM